MFRSCCSNPLIKGEVIHSECFENVDGKRAEQAAEEGNCDVGSPPKFGGVAGPYLKFAKRGNTSRSADHATHRG
jgi:hypothetical protein